ncbi:Pug1p TDEL_0G04930 [Torulaspora delbrueckii]|uniref:Uncharacterized protein n=1 Tax=Torulaspora delbrueckii TaxID=4950 RepID=G8ZY93_TORDE|nr:hypothetical protein TDEL_0G04930 [Torulaspora delbrueckii]CCE93860.1 hypothetical protein TDEL_0G04930 [Torulaspora delbrueckii]
MSEDSNTSNDSSGYQLYHYVPNKGAAILFVVLFLLGTFVSAFQVFFWARRTSSVRMNEAFEVCSTKDLGNTETKFVGETCVRYASVSKQDRKLKVSSISCCFIPFFIGCIFEAIGYVARAISASNKQALVPFIIQSVLLLVAPALYAGSIYMLFGRLLRAMECQKLMLVSSRFGTAVFVTGDVLSFLLQSAGGGLMAKEDQADTGSRLVIGGLVVQIVFFGFFIINELRFSVRVDPVCPFFRRLSRKWLYFNWVLLISSLLIMVRSIVRLIEFVEGSDGFIISHEVFIYVFDALPMFLVIVLFCAALYFGNIFSVIDECRNSKNAAIVRHPIQLEEESF